MKLKKGDRVKSVRGSFKGKKGIIRSINSIHYSICCRVLFDGEQRMCTKHFAHLERINMAKLICSDGKEINISAETEQELRAAFGKKEIFYKKGQRFVRNGIEYILAFAGYGMVLIGLHDGHYWASPQPVKNHFKITEVEFDRIQGTGGFVLKA